MLVGDARRKEQEWVLDIETRIANIRAARTGIGQALTRKQALALAGQWYEWFVARHEDDPGDPQAWEARWLNYWDDLEELAPAQVLAASQDDPEAFWAWLQTEDGRDLARPFVSDRAETAQFLAGQGLLNLTHDARNQFVDYVTVEFAEALKLLERRARNDYSPDERLGRFPKLKISSAATRVAGDVTSMQLFAQWVEARKPGAQSVDRWRCVFEHLTQYFTDRSAATISNDEAQQWANSLLNTSSGKRSRGPGTVNDVWCNAASTVFGWAVQTKRIEANPFKGVFVTRQRSVSTRDGKHFTDEEAALILCSALAIECVPDRPVEAAKRWVPWICAYTGARGGEITQLRCADVLHTDGCWAIRITPEAGTVKNRKPRTVPLHEHLLEQGFLQFVHQKQSGPLFYNSDSPSKAKRPNDPLKPIRPRAVITRNRVGEWVRDIGVTDEAIRPNHAWRHTFKLKADRAEISDKVSDAITGHAQVSEGRKYGLPTVADMARALEKFPRYALETPPQTRPGGSGNVALAGTSRRGATTQEDAEDVSGG